MNLLAIDTSNPHGSVTLHLASGDLHTRSGGEGHFSQRLFVWLDELEKLEGLENGFRSLHAVAVTSGPGIFTGLRVGVAAAKGIALSAGIPVIPMPTLRIMAAAAAGDEALRRPLLPAGRGELYTALFRMSESAAIEQLQPDVVIPPDSLELEESDEAVLIHGAGVRLMPKAARCSLPSGLRLDDHQPLLAPALCEAALQRMGKQPVPRGTRVEISYIRDAAG